jgi:hypothetical protein
MDYISITISSLIVGRNVSKMPWFQFMSSGIQYDNIVIQQWEMFVCLKMQVKGNQQALSKETDSITSVLINALDLSAFS